MFRPFLSKSVQNSASDLSGAFFTRHLSSYEDELSAIWQHCSALCGSELSKPNKIFLPVQHKNSATGNKILPVDLMENKI
jgi:hypothetical protein